MIVHDARPNSHDRYFQTALAFRPHVEPGELVVVGGASETDQHGLQRASDPPYYLFWLDRKGFVLHDDELSVERLSQLRLRGARYYLAEQWRLKNQQEFLSSVKRKFRILAEENDTLLIDLGERAESELVQKPEFEVTRENDA